MTVHRASPELRQAQQLIALPTTGAGELYVAVQDGNGRVRTHDQPVSYADTTHGRYLTITTGHDSIRISPADGPVLVARLHTFHRRPSTP